MYCLRCGKEIEDTAVACPYCNAPTENDAQNPFISGGFENKSKSDDNLASIGLILGIVGIVMAWLFAILGYCFGGAALAISIVTKNKNPDNEKAKKGFTLAIIALACSVLNSILGFMIML